MIYLFYFSRSEKKLWFPILDLKEKNQGLNKDYKLYTRVLFTQFQAFCFLLCVSICHSSTAISNTMKDVHVHQFACVLAPLAAYYVIVLAPR